MTDASPIPVIWRDGTFIPATQRQALRCKEQFMEGGKYVLVEHHERSAASHSHYFACVATGWANLPESMADQFPTAEHLRKYALIATGYCDKEVEAYSTPQDALKAAARSKRKRDDFILVTIDGSAVTTYYAKSQSMRAMGAKDFQESKDKVLIYIADLCGITLAALTENAGKAA